ncbi:MAG TPA: hypothetical protein VMT99_01310 [Candidatus Paceibacterota bacterium]|nr:hypothetical protein [Candidatus Paceibacterota bacterium]
MRRRTASGWDRFWYVWALGLVAVGIASIAVILWRPAPDEGAVASPTDVGTLLQQAIGSELRNPIGGWDAGGAKPLATSSLPVVCASEGEREDFSCYEAFYKDLVLAKGVDAAFADLKARFTVNDYVSRDCHPITHIIGQAAVSLYPSVAEAYRHGDAFCASGYYHGVLEGLAFRMGKDKLLENLNTICDGLGSSPASTDYFSCLHGLGHGLMEITDDDLFASLNDCDRLTGMWQQTSCYGGVFMENVIVGDIHQQAIDADHVTKYLRPDEPFYPCTAVGEQYKAACYLIQPSYALDHLGDPSKVFALCDQAEEAYRGLCYQSIGRDADGRDVYDASTTVAVCGLGTDFYERSSCIEGAVQDFIYQYDSKFQARELCGAIGDADLRRFCEGLAT